MTTEAPFAVERTALAPVIKATGLTKSYGRHMAIDHIDLEIAAGRIIGLIGPNGAGKTTLMKAILGLANCDGKLEVLGLDPTSQRSQLMEDVCFIADVAVLPRWIRVSQLIELTGKIHPRFSQQRCLDYLAKTKINQDSKVKTLSKGMVAQLHLALVMSIDARLLVLDEPTLGLDILYRKEFYANLLNDYFDEERSIIITTHQVEEVEHILTDLIFINDGKISLNCSMEEVQQRFVELMVKPDQVSAARALGPMHESQSFGRHAFLFEGVDRKQLAEMGETRTPSVADLFVAIMSPRINVAAGGQS